MIHRTQMMQLLVTACPSFAARFAAGAANDYQDENGETLEYLALSDFSSHILSLIAAQQFDELPATFAVVERLHVEGDKYVREAATVGLLEALQNDGEHRKVEKSRITKWFGPETQKWWDRLNNFWAGDAGALRETD